MKNTAKPGAIIDRTQAYRAYIREVERYPRVSAEEEQQLATDIQQAGLNPARREEATDIQQAGLNPARGDEATANGEPTVSISDEAKERGERALQHLVCANLRFVVTVANQCRYGMSLMDAIQEGNMGLIEAARRYRPGYQVRFIQYAVFWIRKSILAAVRGTVEQEHDALSLDAPLRGGDDDDTLTLSDTLATPDAASPEYCMDMRNITTQIDASMHLLTPRQQYIINHTYGLRYATVMSIPELALRLGLTRQRVNQLRRNALAILRRSPMLNGYEGGEN